MLIEKASCLLQIKKKFAQKHTKITKRRKIGKGRFI